MKIGFLTNSLVTTGMKDLQKIFKWAKESGFQAIEIGPGVPLNLEKLKRFHQDYNLEIISFIYMRNILSSNEKERKNHINKIKERIDIASELGVRYVTISTGRDKKISYEENLLLFKKEFPPLLKYAEEKDVTIAFENCPGMWNIAISPFMWEKIFKMFPSSHLGLCFDPSHFVWLNIDPCKTILDFKDRICYIHAKDTELLRDKLTYLGIITDYLYYGDQAKPELKWWRHRIPGWGEINWKKIITALMEIHFDGVVSIEHEDPVWSGSEDKVKRGLTLAREYLRNIL